MRRRFGWIGLVLLGLVGLTAVAAVVTPMGRYIARGAWEEGKILMRRRSIDRIISDSATPPATRAKLELVLAARQFAVDSLGLPAKKAFTKFTQLDHDTLVLVLSGTRRDALVPATWWFPVVGRVPYKGFFDFEAAKRAERALASDGFDTYLRPAPAFSTLGWFNDPLLSTTLATDSLFIVQTVIHELTHNRIYVNGEAVFNESLAEFVGNRGAVEFFRSLGDTAGARRAEARWADDLLLGTVWERGYREIDSVFRARPYPDDGRDDASPAHTAVRTLRLAARDTVYARLRLFLADTVAPRLVTIDRESAARLRLDNAALLARRIYATGLGDFEAAWERDGRSVRATLDRITDAVAKSRGDPFAAIR
ncbi:MAG: aminopeptidase [Gemmatimonadetes bacterium]|nr:aminopeptidase [Gemmatimonadota bacterium]